MPDELKRDSKIGRPAWHPDKNILKEAKKLAACGLTEDQIADSLGICRSTLFKKKGEFPDFSHAIKKGKAQGIYKIANSLFEKAVKGDTTAMIFFLKCRAGWNDKKEEQNKWDRPVEQLSNAEIFERLQELREQRLSL